MSKIIDRVAKALEDNPGSVELIQGEALHLARVAIGALSGILSASQNSSLGYAGDALEDELKEDASESTKA